MLLAACASTATPPYRAVPSPSGDVSGWTRSAPDATPSAGWALHAVDGRLFAIGDATDPTTGLMLGGYVHRVDPRTGDTIWSTEVQSNRTRFAPVAVADSLLIPLEDAVAAVSLDEGTPRWVWRSEREIPIAAFRAQGRHAAVALYDGALLILDAQSGAQRSRVLVDRATHGTTIEWLDMQRVAGQGWVFVLSRDTRGQKTISSYRREALATGPVWRHTIREPHDAEVGAALIDGDVYTIATGSWTSVERLDGATGEPVGAWTDEPSPSTHVTLVDSLGVSDPVPVDGIALTMQRRRIVRPSPRGIDVIEVYLPTASHVSAMFAREDRLALLHGDRVTVVDLDTGTLAGSGEIAAPAGAIGCANSPFTIDRQRVYTACEDVSSTSWIASPIR